MTNLTEGWTWVIGARKWHYLRDHESLCGNWLVLGNPELEQGNDASKDNCTACRKKLEREKVLKASLAR